MWDQFGSSEQLDGQDAAWGYDYVLHRWAALRHLRLLLFSMMMADHHYEHCVGDEKAGFCMR